MRIFLSLFLFFFFAGCSVLPIYVTLDPGKAPTFKQNKLENQYAAYSKVGIGKWKDGDNRVLINGIPVDRHKYPWVLWLRSGNARCSASLVGPQAVITAAHCVGDGKSITFKTHNGVSHKGTCAHHPEYATADHDIALCKLDAPILHIKPKRMHLNQHARMDMRIQLFGFGCIWPGGGGGNDGILRMGHSRIRGAVGRHLYSHIVGDDNAALCSGDSGGPVLSPEEDILAIHSRANLKDRNWTVRLDRWAKAWILDQARVYDIEVCHEENRCEEEDPPELQPDEFECKNESVHVVGRIFLHKDDPSKKNAY